MRYSKEQLNGLFHGLHCQGQTFFKMLLPDDRGWFRMEIEDEQVFYVWEPMAAKDEPELKQILRRAGEEQKAVLMFPSQELASMEGRTLHGDQDRLEAQIMDYIQGNNGKVHQCEVLKNLPYLETKVCLIRLYFKGVLDYNWQESAFEIVVTLFPVKNCLTEGQELDIIADSGD